MDLLKAFDTVNHQLVIAKLSAYGFSKSAMELIFSYLNGRWRRTKINTSFSTWAELLSGVPRVPSLVLLFLAYTVMIRFIFFDNISVCNIADDTTPYVCDTNLSLLLQYIKSYTMPSIMWLEANYMKLNEDKCPFFLAGNTPEFLWAKVGEEIIWVSNHEKLLGIIIDKKTKF